MFRTSKFKIANDRATNATMTPITPEWIRDQISGRRGVQAALAKAIGLTAPQMSLVMSGSRKITSEEATKIAEFFNGHFPLAQALTEGQQQLLEASFGLTEQELQFLINAARAQHAARQEASD